MLWGSNLHWVLVEDERRDNRLDAAPCKVRVPRIVWVSPAPKVRVDDADVVLLRLLKVVEPVICWFVPSNEMVPELWVNVPDE